MPFTPFHLGFGAVAKLAGQKNISFLVFGGSQVLMDIEPGVRLLTGSSILHGPSHTLVGAIVIGLLATLVGKPITNRVLGLVGTGVSAISWTSAAVGAFTGTLSHILLDGVMHADMSPFPHCTFPWLSPASFLGSSSGCNTKPGTPNEQRSPTRQMGVFEFDIHTHTMKHTYTLLLLVLMTPTASAGQVFQDTLDWHRYAPLEVGNEWHYEDAEGGPASKFLIRADTVVGGTAYFIGRETFYSTVDTPWSVVPPREVFIRYDTSGVVAEFEHPDADSGAVPSEFSRGLESFPAIDLRTAFETTVGTGEEAISVTGGFDKTLQVGGHAFMVDAHKKAAQNVWFWSYAADIGFMGGGNLWGPRLRYARIGGVEYGAVYLAAEAPFGQLPDPASLTVYPNPARKSVSVGLPSGNCFDCSLVMEDILGRRVTAVRAIAQSDLIYTLDVSMLAPGVYFVRLLRGPGLPPLVRSVLVR